jgi:sec-independent protein translocase protein TatC
VDDRRLPLTEHLAELRRRILAVLAVWALASTACWSLREEVFALLLRPALVALAPDGGQLQAIAPAEIFFTYLKCALLGGFVLGLPVLFWHAWAFVAPGLYETEKRLVAPFALASTGLFLAGAAFGYYMVFPLVFRFFAAFESDLVQSAWTMQEVFGFTTRLFLAFGIAFELPIVVVLLSIAGIVSAAQLLRWTPYAVLVIFIAAAALTPPDWVSQVLLGIPMVGLYLLGVGAAWLFGDRRRAAAAVEDASA